MRIVNAELKTFEEFRLFIDAIYFGESNPNSFIFRGQAQDWPLIPSIYRDNNIELIRNHSNFEKSVNLSAGLYRDSEDNLLLKFFNYANHSGLKVPKTPRYSSRLLPILDPLVIAKNIDGEWPPEDLTELSALAQHYGIPTSLIDWSFDANVALYFAVFGAIKDALKNEHQYASDNVVIWILSLHSIASLQNFSKCSSGEIKWNCIPIKFVVPSYYNNPNINAQKGILSYWPEGQTDLRKEIDKKPLDDKIDEFDFGNIPEYYKKNAENLMYKILIPTSECVRIAKHLFNTNYNASRLFPGYSGVVQSIEERDMIRKAEEVLLK